MPKIPLQRWDAFWKDVMRSPGMLKSLLDDFVARGDRRINFGRATLCPNNYVKGNLRQCACDMLWKIEPAASKAFYIYILLEFQSTVDADMPRRIGKYAWQALNDLEDQEALWPPILPIVIYTGARKWTASRHLRSRFQKAGTWLDDMQPDMTYELVDVQRLKPDELRRAKNGIAWIFRALQVKTPEDALELNESIKKELRAPDLEGLFAMMAHYMLFLRFNDEKYLEMGRKLTREEQEMFEYVEIPDPYASLREEAISQGLAEGMAKGHEEGLKAGIEKGHKEGHEEGLKAGIKKGLEEGIKEGREEGIKEGRKEGIKEGRKEGIKEGREEGIKEGRKEGIKEGREEGIKEGRKEGIKEGREEGIKEGRKEGMTEGMKAGRLEGRDEACKGLHCELFRLLGERFGKVPCAWNALVEAVGEPPAIARLIANVYRVNSEAEYERDLRAIASAAKSPS